MLVEPVVFDDEVPESAQDSLYERTRKRKRWFESAEAMFRNLEHKPPFNTWRRDMLRDYCEYGTRPAPQGGVELKCPPEIEADFYSRAREFPGLTLMLKSRSPLLLMFGEKSDSTGDQNRGQDRGATGERHGRHNSGRGPLSCRWSSRKWSPGWRPSSSAANSRAR